jgi:FtsP/CotA-like multicopper oxidase with cupredoxin domain
MLFLIQYLLLFIATASAVPSGHHHGYSGRKKKFSLKLTWEEGSPNGGPKRDMIFVNGQFPGPTLRIDQHDEVEICVESCLPYNSTVHFHGRFLSLL